jgi:hypothetical protein
MDTYKGLAKIILHESLLIGTVITLAFHDKSTDTILTADIPFFTKPIDSGATTPFDTGTGYGAKQANQFQFMKALLTY